MGKPATGKTAILSRFITGDYIGDYFPTLGVDFTQKSYRKRTLFTYFFDFGGTSLPYLFSSHFLEDTDLVLFVCETFSQEESAWISKSMGQIETFNRGKTEFLIIRNKIDKCPIEEQELQLLQDFQKGYKINFVAVSAKSGKNFETLKSIIFQTLQQNSEALYVAGAYLNIDITEEK